MFEIGDTIIYALNSGFINPYDVGGDGQGGVFYGAALNAITAAYATVGYWIQADVLYYLKASSLGAWAPLVYILAAFGGLFSMAMGQPPRNWLWFFIGPAFYWWLIDTPVKVDGVAWRVGNTAMPQQEVWRYAETGLANTSLYARTNNTVSSTDKPQAQVEVAMPFVWFDALMSSTVQSLSSWLGPQNLRNQAQQNSNITGQASTDNKKWFMLSNLKWKYLQDITNARLASVEARDMVARFFSSECGDQLAASINIPKYLAASNTQGQGLPDTVFQKGGPENGQYEILRRRLAEEWVPVPRSIKHIFEDRSASSFYSAINWGNTIDNILSYDRLRCNTYFHIMVYYLRWESGGIYEQTFSNSLPGVSGSGAGDSGLQKTDVAYNLLYGWDIKKERSETGVGSSLNVDEQEAFVKNLILIHLIRNELAMVPKPVTAGHAESELTQLRADSFVRTVGSTSKYGEVYTWAMMIPHIQGILLMLLTMAYPFVAIVLLIPGQHGIVFTWMSFFAWAKLWDLGFALVSSIERSIWATLGAGSNSAVVNDRVVKMMELGSVERNGCAGQSTIGDACYAPIIQVTDGIGGGVSNALSADIYRNNLGIFDLGLSLGSNINLDVANGYYIYLMAALYFAVPAVTGQLVLGAKAGAASLVDQGTSDISQKGGMGAQRGYEGALSQKFMSNQASVRQATKAKAFRASGLAHQALGHQNSSLEEGITSAAYGQMASGHERIENALAFTRQAQDGYASADFTALTATTGAEIKNSANASKGKPGGRDSEGRLDEGPEKVGGGEGGGGERAFAQQEYYNNTNAIATGDDTEPGKAATKDMRARMMDGGMSQKDADKINLEGGFAIAKGYGDARRFDRFAVDSNTQTALKGGDSIAGFAANQRSGAYRTAGDRLMAQAEFQAAADTYDTLNHFANQMASDVTIAGANIGQLDPGARPDDTMGMAMSGMLNTNTRDTRSRAQYAAPGGKMFGFISEQQSNLNQNYGVKAIQGKYQSPVAGQGLNYSFAAVPKELFKALGGGSKTGEQIR